jgi:hypothetical protein
VRVLQPPGVTMCLGSVHNHLESISVSFRFDRPALDQAVAVCDHWKGKNCEGHALGLVVSHQTMYAANSKQR